MNTISAMPQLSEREQVFGLFWDLYKDVNGVRPRWVSIDTPIAELNRMIDSLQVELEEEIEREAAEMRSLMDALDAPKETLLRWEDEAFEFEMWANLPLRNEDIYPCRFESMAESLGY